MSPVLLQDLPGPEKKTPLNMKSVCGKKASLTRKPYFIA